MVGRRTRAWGSSPPGHLPGDRARHFWGSRSDPMTIARRFNAGGRLPGANVPKGRLKIHWVEWDDSHLEK
jgi:hypothetical protein